MKVKLKSFIADHLKVSTPFLKKENIIKLPHKDIKYLKCENGNIHEKNRIKIYSKTKFLLKEHVY